MQVIYAGFVFVLADARCFVRSWAWFHFCSAGVGFLQMHGLGKRYCLFGLEEVTVLLVGSSWRARYMVSFTRVED